MDVTVSLHLMPEWSFSAIHPTRIPQTLLDGGQNIQWKVTTQENGALIDQDSGSILSLLGSSVRLFSNTSFWSLILFPLYSTNPSLILPNTLAMSRSGTPSVDNDSSIEFFDPSRPSVTPSNSVVHSSEKVPSYLDQVLLAMGLHTEARTSFITLVTKCHQRTYTKSRLTFILVNRYWLPDMLRHKYVALRFLPQKAYERAAPLSISPLPASITRVFMLWRGLSTEDIEGNENIWSDAISKASGMRVKDWVGIVGAAFPPSSVDQKLRILEWGGMEVNSFTS
jgi:hypothetical protein